MSSNLSDPASLRQRLRPLPLPAVTSPAASGWSNSYRVGYLPPTGVTRPFHGAPRILIKNPVDAYIPASAICKCCSRGSGVRLGVEDIVTKAINVLGFGTAHASVKPAKLLQND
jgi:hypothetical protein